MLGAVVPEHPPDVLGKADDGQVPEKQKKPQDPLQKVAHEDGGKVRGQEVGEDGGRHHEQPDGQ